MYEVILIPLGILLLIHTAVLPHPKTRPCGHNCVLQYHLVKLVYKKLRAFAHINVAETGRRTRHREQRVKDNGILAVVVEPALRVFGVVFGRIQHFAVTELTVMQHVLAVPLHLVVPVNHGRFVSRVYGIIVYVLCSIHSRR